MRRQLAVFLLLFATFSAAADHQQNFSLECNNFDEFVCERYSGLFNAPLKYDGDVWYRKLRNSSSALLLREMHNIARAETIKSLFVHNVKTKVQDVKHLFKCKIDRSSGKTGKLEVTYRGTTLVKPVRKNCFYEECSEFTQGVVEGCLGILGVSENTSRADLLVYSKNFVISSKLGVRRSSQIADVVNRMFDAFPDYMNMYTMIYQLRNHYNPPTNDSHFEIFNNTNAWQLITQKNQLIDILRQRIDFFNKAFLSLNSVKCEKNCIREEEYRSSYLTELQNFMRRIRELYEIIDNDKNYCVRSSPLNIPLPTLINIGLESTKPAHFYGTVVVKMIEETHLARPINITQTHCRRFFVSEEYHANRNVIAQKKGLREAYNLFIRTNPLESEKQSFFIAYAAFRCNGSNQALSTNGTAELLNARLKGMKVFSDLFQCSPTDKLYASEDQQPSVAREYSDCF